jgi:hypothetical protein
MATTTTAVNSPSTKAAIKRWKQAKAVAAEYLRVRQNGSTMQVYDFRTGEVLGIAPVRDQEALRVAGLWAMVELAERSGAERPWIRTVRGDVVQTQ